MKAIGLMEFGGPEVLQVVIPTGPHGGTYAEQIVVGEASVVHAPHGVAFPEASTLLLNATTARLSLDALSLPQGTTVAVVGGAGAVGGYAIQLAKADGLTVLADAALRDETVVRGLGADIVIERGDEIGVRIRSRFPSGVPGHPL